MYDPAHNKGGNLGGGVRWGLDSEISIRGTPFFVGDSLSYVEEASKVKA
jgi:hypothetical protein